MTSKKLGLIHTSATLVPVFEQLCAELIPDMTVFNIADDSLIKDVISHGSLTDSVSKRLANHIQSAEMAGADLIMVTCSSIGEAAEQHRSLVQVPVIRVDQAMADHAVGLANKIGVVATLPTTLGPTAAMIERTAVAANKQIDVISKLCQGAFEALMRGHAAAHDEMVREQLTELLECVDVVLLAQASMARVIQQLPADVQTQRVFSSPRLAVESLVSRLA